MNVQGATPVATVDDDQWAIVRGIRWILLIALWTGLIGTGTELVLLEHYEEWRQMIPLGLIACGLLVLAWNAVDQRGAPLRMLQVLMIVFTFAGTLGIVFHYRGNAEFELEMYPSRTGMALFREAIMGATPALAPGSMVQMALIGLAYAHRHPRLRRGNR